MRRKITDLERMHAKLCDELSDFDSEDEDELVLSPGGELDEDEESYEYEEDEENWDDDEEPGEEE